MPKPTPVIGITKPDNESLVAFTAITWNIRLLGGKVEVISPSRNWTNKNIDGLILGGGKDIFPGLYNHAPKDNYQYDEKRDEMEIFWAERAKEEGIPTLGICRGAQLINVICGGTLHPSVRDVYQDDFYPDKLLHHIFYRKAIFLEPESLLYSITKEPTLKVNSIHQQGVNQLGKNLTIDASEKNGLAQAISMPDHPFYLGVQFHPEFLSYNRSFRKIFESLIQAASERG